MESAVGGKIESKDYKKFIPLNKSWINRMGILDMIHGYPDIKEFLDEQKDLGDDLLALKRALEVWNTDELIDVGESGTLYRILQFASWKLGLNKKFITRGTLTERIKRGAITQDPNIVNLSIGELLNLPEKTTQWATASVLLGNSERLPNAEHHLAMTFEAVDHWKEKRSKGTKWDMKYDATIQAQAEAFLQMLKGARPSFIPVQAEDYCFARAFGYISREEGEARWPKLQGHETPRLDEMERVMDLAENGDPIDSRDHRVVQAMAMWGIVNKKELIFTHPEAVNKTWPQFWDFTKEQTNK